MKNVNLDAMSPEELLDVTQAEDIYSAEQIAYAGQARMAMLHRLAGRIGLAMQYENAAERAYGSLPEGLRW